MQGSVPVQNQAQQKAVLDPQMDELRKILKPILDAELGAGTPAFERLMSSRSINISRSLRRIRTFVSSRMNSVVIGTRLGP